MNQKIGLAIIIFIIGHTLTWFNINSQFAWEYWKDKPLLAAIIYSVPISLLFWYGAKLMFETHGAWGARLVGFAASYATFPLLTFIFLNESIFQVKTFLCLLLSIGIIAIQIFWK